MEIQQIRGLYYMTHVDNVPSILKRGIFSHGQMLTSGIDYTSIYDCDIVSNRKDIITPDGRSLWEFANLYFQPRNPMLYRVIHEKSANELAIICVRPEILSRSDIYITTGNAAHSNSEILPSPVKPSVFSEILKHTLPVEWWKEQDGSKRTIMAECLVPGYVPAEMIQTVYVDNHEVKSRLETTIVGSDIPIIIQPPMFFDPSWGRVLTPKLILAQGDMFFSRMQTLTISVNTVGVMGKGLASRTKYQFADVYVYYQDLCRNRKLTMGRPRIYKREASLEYELAFEPQTLSNGNTEKWFLLFPTKRHWRELADIKGIEEGLVWLVENYKKEGIKSLAMPALGCGLGKLEWKDVGPLMCRYLNMLDINVVIYLPSEHKIPIEFLTSEFLLGQK